MFGLCNLLPSLSSGLPLRSHGALLCHARCARGEHCRSLHVDVVAARVEQRPWAHGYRASSHMSAPFHTGGPGEGLPGSMETRRVHASASRAACALRSLGALTGRILRHVEPHRRSPKLYAWWLLHVRKWVSKLDELPRSRRSALCSESSSLDRRLRSRRTPPGENPFCKEPPARGRAARCPRSSAPARTDALRRVGPPDLLLLPGRAGHIWPRALLAQPKATSNNLIAMSRQPMNVMTMRWRLWARKRAGISLL